MIVGYYLLSGLAFIHLTMFAITDDDDYKKYGPRELYFFFILLWGLGYITGKFG